MEEAERLCDRVAIMDHGHVIALGTPKELIATVGGEDIVEFAVEFSHGSASESPRDAVAGCGGAEGDSRCAVASRG